MMGIVFEFFITTRCRVNNFFEKDMEFKEMNTNIKAKHNPEGKNQDISKESTT